jgi:hypothetical protein
MALPPGDGVASIGHAIDDDDVADGLYPAAIIK